MTHTVQQYVQRLKSRHEEVRNKAARELSIYVKTELREASQEEITAFMDEFNHHIFEMVSGTDMNERKGGILAIVCLIGADVGNINTRTIRFANYLRNLLPSSDVGVMELAAKTVGKLALVSGTYTAAYVEFEVKRAFEWLGGDRNEGKRHAAVLVLKELAVSMPTYFFQQVTPFFEVIFNAVRDPKAVIREGAVEALRAALVVTAQRETAKQMHKSQWYKQCYDEIVSGFEDVYTRERGFNRDDRIHGSLLVLNELLRCSNIQWERKYEALMEKLNCSTQKKENDILLLMPHLKSTVVSKWSISSRNTLNAQSPHHPAHESAACRSLMLEKLDDINNEVMNQRVSRNVHIQHALMTLLPRLAAFNKEKFVKNNLHDCIIYLLMTLKNREKDRAAAFTTIGLIAVAVEDAIKPYRSKIMEMIKSSLPSKEMPNKKRVALEPAVFVCITLLGHAVKQTITADVKDLLESMLATGLSPILTTSLRELAHNVPSLKPDISQGLLRMLSQVLMHKPLRHPGAPWSVSSPIMTPPTEVDVPSTVLALRTLGTFDFDGNPLLQFVRRCADHFLTSEQAEVRLEAVRTCSRLLRLALNQPGPTVTTTVSSVVGKLLDVGIIDTDPDVRFWVLASLDESFDVHLAQAESLSALFVAMNDEVFEIREIAIRTIGRLSTMNPAYVMPSLRKTLIQFLTELEHSGMGRNKEQAARMLDHLVVSAPRLIRPYMNPILNVLLPKLKESEPNPGVILAILRAIGDLAEVNGAEMQKRLEELLSILLEMLVDASSPEKRGVALWVLGQLVGSTGYVVKPYMQYPTLLDVLINFLKTEQQTHIRRETIRVLGLLGALDPYKHKMNLGQIDSQLDMLTSMADIKSDAEANQDLTTSEMLVNMSSSTLEEYYPAIAIATLMRIIRDPTLSQHHTMVVQAVTFIFKSLGIKCVPYISQVMPSFLNVVRTADMNFREYLFQQLAILIAIVKQHIRNYLDDIFTLIKEFWTVNSPMQTTLILLVEHIAVALGAEFKIYLPQLMPQILRVLTHDSSKDRAVTVKLLLALQKFGNNLDNYLHLVLPPIVKLFHATDCPITVNRIALETVDHLADTLDFTDFASRIIHPLVRTLDQCPELRETAMDTLCALIIQLGKKYKIFILLVQKVINKHKITNPRYECLVNKIDIESSVMDTEDYLLFKQRQIKNKNRDPSLMSSDTTTIKRLHVEASNLQKAWTATRRVSKDDWLEWLKSLSIGLLKESPSPALRSCWALAQTYSQLPRDLFNAAFVSCWTELNENYRAELIQTLQQALMVPDLPEITQTILNLAEFMEHCDKGPLPLDTKILGERAMHCRAYAKALHYKEDEFHRSKNKSDSERGDSKNNDSKSNVYESLISINNKLQQKEAAEGLLEYVMNQHSQPDLKVQVRWYEKLHNWDKAYHLYKERLESDPNDVESTLGEMRCLEALGEWGQLHEVAMKQWSHQSEETKQRMARMAAAAAWGLNQWESMQKYVSLISKDTQDGAFYRAVLAIHDEKYDVAHELIESARDLLDTELTAMAGESYQRAYNAMVEVQKLAELEEVIQFKLVPERRPTIKNMWWERLQGGQRIVEDWQKIIQVHTLVISPQDDMYTWLKYASLCRKSGNLMLCHKTLVMLLGMDPSLVPDKPLPTLHPQVIKIYIYID